MLRRRRIQAFHRGLWILFGILCLLFMASTSILFQIYRDGYSLRHAYAIQDLLICRLFEWFLGIWVFIVGSCVASFLNVVAYRLPAGLPITGTSFCPHCRTTIQPADNIPVLGWFLLGGRCRTCRLSISPRYPVFEFIGGLLALSVFLSTVLSHGSNLPLDVASELPYGMPVNLQMMDDRILFIAGLHAFLLFLLYAAALTSLAHGRLPFRVWLVGGVAILTVVAVRPDVCVLPFVEDFSKRFLPAISESARAHALIASILGGLVSASVAGCWRISNDRAGWIGACSLVGLTFGWQASIGVLFLASIPLFFEMAWRRYKEVERTGVVESSSPSFTPPTDLPCTEESSVEKPSIDRSRKISRSVSFSTLLPFCNQPLQLLWLWTAVFLIFWRQLHELFQRLI